MSREQTARVQLHDFQPELETFREDVVRGLQQPDKSIPCKYLYDERGSQLFDQICELEEYYPTRTEIEIMRWHSEEMAEYIGPGSLLIEYGSGSSKKARFLLDHLRDPAAYVPIDISREHLAQSAAALASTYRDLPVHPVCADYTGSFTLPACERPVSRRVAYFPGSTIGNFSIEEARQFLKQVADVCGRGGGLLIGVDLKKDPAILEAAYNDRKGVTAAFNLNLLERINRELEGDFRLDQFRYEAPYNVRRGRIEMYLVSRPSQMVHLDDVTIPFREGEGILTECSYKYALDDFAQLAASAGFKVKRVWTDERRLFSVQYLTVG
jgi:dimethylhistidine N-methyltransferase